MDSYELTVNDILIDVQIVMEEEESIPIYNISITNISDTTKIILEKIREEFIESTARAASDKTESTIQNIQEEFKKNILGLLKKYFHNANKKTMDMLINYVLQQNIGLGNVEILLKDNKLEEIVINNAHEFLWVYHIKFGWLKTRISLAMLIFSERKPAGKFVYIFIIFR